MSTDPAPRTLHDVVTERMQTLGIPSWTALAVRCGVAVDTVRLNVLGRRVPTEATLRALAHGLSVPVQHLRRAAGVPAGEREPFTAPPEWDRLSREQRAVLHAVADALLQAGQAGSAPAPVSAPTSDAVPAVRVVRPQVGVSPIRDRQVVRNPTQSQTSRWAARSGPPKAPIPQVQFEDGT